MGERKTPLDALKIFARNFVTHNVTLLTIVQFLASTSLVNTNHSDTDGPSGLADTQTQVAVVGINVAALLHSLDNFDNGFEERVVKISFFELAE